MELYYSGGLPHNHGADDFVTRLYTHQNWSIADQMLLNKFDWEEGHPDLASTFKTYCLNHQAPNWLAEVGGPNDLNDFYELPLQDLFDMVVAAGRTADFTVLVIGFLAWFKEQIGLLSPARGAAVYDDESDVQERSRPLRTRRRRLLEAHCPTLDEQTKDSISMLESDSAVLFRDVLESERVFKMVVLAVELRLERVEVARLRTALLDARGLPSGSRSPKIVENDERAVQKWAKQCRQTLSRDRQDREYQIVLNTFKNLYVRGLMETPEVRRLSERHRRAVVKAVGAR